MRWLWVVLALSCAPGPVDEAVDGPVPGYRVAAPGLTEGAWTNRLVAAHSPYLRQHAHNPVDWYPWGEEAFAAARARGVPIFLSIGYAACHWCHVMEAESFADPVLAAYLNEHFVPVKVDREERPDVDAVYMDAVVGLSGSGGWPASLWLTPDGAPFFAGTYFPPVTRGGRPAFRDVLAGVVTAWREDPEGVRSDAGALVEALRRAAAADAADPPEREAARAALAATLDAWDPETRGWGRRKFPHAPRLRAVLDAAAAGDARAADVLAATLDAMDRGGLHDHVGGGFHRYTVDPAWRVPHFEKMLVDNAQLVGLYAEASRALGDPALAAPARDTAAFLLRDLRLSDGSFASSLDADAAGVEGSTYTWTPDEVVAALGDRAGEALVALQITPEGNVEGGRTVLTRPVGPPVDEALLAALRVSRARRPQPPRDDKVVVAYGALAISGLARAGAALREPAWIEAAGLAAARLLDDRAARGHLPRTLAPGAPAAVLEDRALLADALLDLHAADGDPRWLLAAADLLAEVDALWDEPLGAWRHSPAEDLLVRRVELADGPEPAPVAAAIRAHQRLAALGAPAARSDRVAAALRLAAPALASDPPSHLGLATAAARAHAPSVTLVIAAPDRAAAAPFLALWAERPRPGAELAVVTDAAAEALAGWSGLADKTPLDGAARAYLCVDGACRAPTTEVEAVRAGL